MDVSKNNGTPKSSILIGVSIIFTIHFGGKIPLFLETPKSQLLPRPMWMTLCSWMVIACGVLDNFKLNWMMQLQLHQTTTWGWGQKAKDILRSFYQIIHVWYIYLH